MFHSSFHSPYYCAGYIVNYLESAVLDYWKIQETAECTSESESGQRPGS
jgi:hypothetical protein